MGKTRENRMIRQFEDMNIQGGIQEHKRQNDFVKAATEIFTNKTVLKKDICLKMEDICQLFSDTACKTGEKIAADLSALAQDIVHLTSRRFVLMKNKAVWYDRDVAGLFPKLDIVELPMFCCCGKAQIDDFTSLKIDGLSFEMMTSKEFQQTFVKGNGNPYIAKKNNIQYIKYRVDFEGCITQDYQSRCGEQCTKWYYLNGGHSGETCNRSCSSKGILIPIYRLNGENASAMTSAEIFLAWIANALIPEGLTEMQEVHYRQVIEAYPNIYEYLSSEQNSVIFDHMRFNQDVMAGKFVQTVFDYDFNLSECVNAVRLGKKKVQFQTIPEVIKQNFLQSDWKRANIQPYEEKRLTDINLGHWELFEGVEESDNQKYIKTELPDGKVLIARPPQLDVMLNGTCGIDFGTKSTIVVCRNQEARLLRIGKGDYAKEPSMADYENPTVIEMRDLAAFRKAYEARMGRPFTQWEQLTVSHQAADAIFQNDGDSTVYYSVFSELKQWANDKDRRLMLTDRRGDVIELKPYLELKEGDFDPIEVYAYYLGLYINNMHNGIYLDYIMSFPVNYEKAVRERIRESFERGIKKSMPPALVKDTEVMQRFRVYGGASEPAAYAISALQELGLEPETQENSVAYGVFDFGGGTTDFDFGIESIPANRRRKFQLEQFGFGGDPYLGGENILALMAYEVFKDNLSVMREKKITFVLPHGCTTFSGSETLVQIGKDASQQAYMNSRRIAEMLRPIWEEKEGVHEKFGRGDTSIHLFSSQQSNGHTNVVEAKLKINVEKLECCIEQRIRQGVESFFNLLLTAFSGKAVYPIHIFLAGNSCKSTIVKNIFDEFIKKHEDAIAMQLMEDEGQQKEVAGTFMLHLPLGVKQSNEVEIDSTQFDRVRTGKTGVAFGLLRSRIGGKDVQIINRNVDENAEMLFPYFLGDIDAKEHFHVSIGQAVGYGQWAPFTYADESEFELYYTKEARALDNQMEAAEVKMLRCALLDGDMSYEDDVMVYIRKKSPDMIEYAVGCPKDFEAEPIKQKIYSQKLS